MIWILALLHLYMALVRLHLEYYIEFDCLIMEGLQPRFTGLILGGVVIHNYAEWQNKFEGPKPPTFYPIFLF